MSQSQLDINLDSDLLFSIDRQDIFSHCPFSEFYETLDPSQQHKFSQLLSSMVSAAAAAERLPCKGFTDFSISLSRLPSSSLSHFRSSLYSVWHDSVAFYVFTQQEAGL